MSPPPSTLSIYFVDAFTLNGNAPYTGNPASVCFLESDDDISDEEKQKISNETNLSDTAFVALRWQKDQNTGEEEDEAIGGSGSSDRTVMRRTIRWFTPMSEVPLCGHATVASVKALVEVSFGSSTSPELLARDEIVIEFESKYRGILGAVYNCKSGRITLDFPSNPCHPLYASGEKWIERLVLASVFPELTMDSIQDIQYSASTQIILLRLWDHLDENDLRRINPEFSRLKGVENCEDMFGVIVTVKGKNGSVESETPHFYSRFFAPWVGVNEDPVCGAAHTVLTPYWTKEYCGSVTNGETLLARQHSVRGGNLFCTMKDTTRVTLGGDARVIIKGELARSD